MTGQDSVPIRRKVNTMSRTYTAAVIGAGSGGKLSLSALAASPRYALLAVADPQAEARAGAASRYPALHTFGTAADLLAACPVDVVCVSTWPPSHLAVVQSALELPLTGILVEKPLGDTHAAGAQILSHIQARRLPMVTPHGLLVSDHGREILQRVREGEIGELQLVEIQCTGWDIINAGIHWLNFVINLLPQDPFVSVMAQCDATTRTYRDNMQVETVAVTYAQSQKGVRVVMQTGDSVQVAQPGEGVLFRLIGDRGRIDFYAWKPVYRIWNSAYPTGHLVEITPGPRSGHQRYLELLAAQMDSGAPDYAIPESSLAALELVEAAYLSSRYGCQLSLPLTDFAPPAPSDWQPGEPYGGQGGGRDGRKLS